MRRKSPRFVTVNAGLRAAIDQQMQDLGLGVTSPQIKAATNTVRKVLNPDEDASVHIGSLARMCISLRMTPPNLEALGYAQVAREMERQEQPDPFTEAVRRSMEPRQLRSSQRVVYPADRSTM